MCLKSGDIATGEVLDFEGVERAVIAATGTDVLLEGNNGAFIQVNVFDAMLKRPGRSSPLVCITQAGPRITPPLK